MQRTGFIAEEVVDKLGERSAFRNPTDELTPEAIRGDVTNFDDRALLAHVVLGLQELRHMVDESYEPPTSQYAS